MGSKKAHPPKDVCMSDDSEKTISKVTFISWNSTGIDGIKCDYLNELMQEKKLILVKYKNILRQQVILGTTLHNTSLTTMYQ